MIDIRLLRSEPEFVKTAMARRAKPALLDDLESAQRLDARLRDITTERDAIRAQINTVSKDIAIMRRTKDDSGAEALMVKSRALGETVAVYTVLNLVYDIRIEVLLSAGGSVASMIVNKFGEADAPELRALMAAGFVLFLVTLLVNFIANIIINRTARKG